MKKYKYLLHIIIIVISILIGLLVSIGSMYLFLIVIILTIISFGVFIIIVIIDMLRKSNHYRKAGYVMIYLVILLISSMFFYKVEVYRRDRVAELIMAELDSIKEIDGKYPLSLENITATSFLLKFNYSIDTIYQEFILWYEVKGWNKKVYYRKENDWRIREKYYEEHF